MPSADDLKKYAEVTLHVGLGLVAGDRLVITASIDTLAFTRVLVDTAYAVGAANVDVIWSDDEVTKSRFTSGSEEAASSISGFGHLLNATVESGDYLLQVKADDPNLLAGQDPERVARFQQANSEFIRPLRDKTSAQEKNWAIVAAPTPTWAKVVFPDLSEDDAVESLWQAIFRTCRVNEPDPLASWQGHIGHLAARSSLLTARCFDALRYSGPGTDLTLGLPVDHRWVGGQTTSAAGVGFVPNLPTEEVFTSPHRLRGDGTITATKPLSLFGSLVEGFGFEVAGGQVVSAHADKGQEILDKVIAMDEGSRRFGEVALVPQSSLVARESLIWQNMLFDENDACHIALGRGFPIALSDGPGMSTDELTGRGINDSAVHVDFVVGSNDLDIYGVDADGSEELILEKGEWAFEA